MSNPARAPLQPTSLQNDLAVAPDAYMPEGWKDEGKRLKQLPHAQAKLDGLDMGLRAAFVLPKQLSVEPGVRQSSTPSLALAARGAMDARLRSSYGKGLANAIFARLPSTGYVGREAVGRNMARTVLVSGGAENTLGRLALAYPKSGSRVAAPVTRAEAQAAFQRCGLTLDHVAPEALRPFPLVAAEGERGIMVNPKSDNGFPVGGKWDTPGAQELCMNLAHTMRQQLEKAPSVRQWKLDAEREAPALVAVKGKAKADYYKVEKVVDARLRFYNVFPRAVMMNMQMATQVLEMFAQNAVSASHVRTAIGVTLTRGGAAALVEAMEGQLAAFGSAYVHVGDDSFVVVRHSGRVHMFALDCSNFDLTQHADTTAEVHARFRDELRRIDRIAADLWYEYARERLVVVAHGLVRHFKHGGPSGMPLQSKVNDVLMDVLLDRIVTGLRALPEVDEAVVAHMVRSHAEAMGFSVRLEQYGCHPGAHTIKECLAREPFLFIGYYFFVREGQVLVHADIARTLAQMPYPSLKWVKGGKEELLLTEAMRLGSVTLNLGRPTAELEDAFEEAGRRAIALVEQAIARFGDVEDARLRWAVNESPWAAQTEASLGGLLRALREKRAALWLPEPELPGTSELVPRPLGGWADEVEAHEAEVGAARPAARRGLRMLHVPRRAAATHPPTRRNDGRPPPTAVWVMPERPALRFEGPLLLTRRTRRDGILAREFQQDFEDEVNAFYRAMDDDESDFDLE